MFSCVPEEQPDTDELQQADMPMQGKELQGIQLQGAALQNMKMVGFRFASATLNGTALANVRIEKGELVAEQGSVTLHGADLVNAHLVAEVRNITASPPTSATVEYQITAVATELSAWDPLHAGNTYLYTLEQWVPETSSWEFACLADSEGNKVAIPVAATWDEHGDRASSSTLFTFGCTTGVIAKCYRWGYRPWVTGYGDLVTAHWTCTRMARADYCGNGRSYTRDGTMINAWDNLPSPGPIMHHTTAPTGMTFEAGWSTSGAVCFSHARWLLDGPLVAAVCPDRLVAPTPLVGGTTCDTEAEALDYGSGVRLFDDSNLNLNLDLF